MNPVALFRNIRHSLQICPSWYDRWRFLLWLYCDKRFLKPWTKANHQISFCYTSPVNNIEVVVRSNKGSDAFIFSEVFDHHYYDFLLPSQPQTILDLGANVGFTAIFFARKYPLAEIACVEPVSNNLDILQKNFELNAIKAKVFPAAIAVEDGPIQMQLAPHDYGHKVAGISYGEVFSGQTVDVEAVSIPTLLKELGWKRIGLLKVDIEGYEAILLKERCEWLSSIDAICIECHEGYDELDLFVLAQRWGFAPPQQLPGTWLLVRK
ncbi:hypothetical protein BZZ01_23880 [Nostocales cyanobacterium HT-58-2]|nr:hypothetical protein BZZ01_23880 [Nostocales cyanobacterium HT-58-2]